MQLRDGPVQLASADRFAFLPQSPDTAGGSAFSEPLREPLDLIIHDRLDLGLALLALLYGSVHDTLNIVEVVQRNIRDIRGKRVDVSRHSEVYKVDWLV